MARINMRPAAGGPSKGKAASGANPKSQPKVSNAPAKGPVKGFKGGAMGSKKGC